MVAEENVHGVHVHAQKSKSKSPPAKNKRMIGAGEASVFGPASAGNLFHVGISTQDTYSNIKQATLVLVS